MIEKLIYKVVYNRCSFKKRSELLRKKGAKIGENCEIYNSVSFGSEPYLIEVGDNVRISANTQITTHDGGLWVLRNIGKLKNADKFAKVIIGDNVHIGINCIIMPGVRIGDNVVIGAGSIVTKDIPSNSVAVGVPCKVIETLDAYYEKNKNKVMYTKNMNYNEKKSYVCNNIDN